MEEICNRGALDVADVLFAAQPSVARDEGTSYQRRVFLLDYNKNQGSGPETERLVEWKGVLDTVRAMARRYTSRQPACSNKQGNREEH